MKGKIKLILEEESMKELVQEILENLFPNKQVSEIRSSFGSYEIILEDLKKEE